MGETSNGPRSSVLSLSALIGGAHELRVPRYQRAYTWSDGEVGQLVEDLLYATAHNAPYYFMGSIVLIRDDQAWCEVVDGQQRLATFALLAAALKVRLEGAPEAEALEALLRARPAAPPRMRLRPSDAETFDTAVTDPRGAANAARTEDEGAEPSPALMTALRVLSEALDDAEAEHGRDRLAALARLVCDRALFNVLETDDRNGAPRLFLVINDTGTDLSAADLVKAALFERATLDEAEGEEAGRRWDSLVVEMGRKDFDEFLAFIPAIVSNAPNSGASAYGALRRGLLDHVDPAKFLREDIHRYADALLAIRRAEVDAGDESAEVNRRIRCMHLHGMGLKAKPWIVPAVAMVAENDGAPERLLPFFQGLERLTYACLLSVIRPHKHTERFAEALRWRRDPTRLYGPGGALELTTDQRKAFIDKMNKPFDREAGVRRIMVLRANAAYGEALTLVDDATVEHILPSGRSDDWRAVFPDPVARRNLTNMLGNFTLITSAQNRASGQKPYAEKRQIYMNWRGAPLRALTKTLRGFPDWTPTSLGDRHEMIVNKLAADWGLVQLNP